MSAYRAYLASYRGIQVTLETRELLLLKSPTLIRSQSRVLFMQPRGQLQGSRNIHERVTIGHRRRTKTGHPSRRSESYYVAICISLT
jgi:hypothetical protein